MSLFFILLKPSRFLNLKSGFGNSIFKFPVISRAPEIRKKAEYNILKR